MPAFQNIIDQVYPTDRVSRHFVLPTVEGVSLLPVLETAERLASTAWCRETCLGSSFAVCSGGWIWTGCGGWLPQ